MYFCILGIWGKVTMYLGKIVNLAVYGWVPLSQSDWENDMVRSSRRCRTRTCTTCKVLYPNDIGSRKWARTQGWMGVEGVGWLGKSSSRSLSLLGLVG